VGAALRAAFAQGRRRRAPPFDLLWLPNTVGYARLAVIVPRHRHTAVERNRLRRRLREILRREVLTDLPPLDLVIRARHDAYGATFDELRVALGQLDLPGR
jgi:ribonuclease P protein component